MMVRLLVVGVTSAVGSFVLGWYMAAAILWLVS